MSRCLGSQYKLGNIDEEKKYAVILIKLDPFDVDGYLNLGNYFLHKQDFKSAALNFDKALIIDPNSPMAMFCRGITSIKQNRPDEAIRWFDTVVNLKDEKRRKDILNYGPIFYFRGIACEMSGKFKEAKKDFEKAKILAPNSKEGKLAALEIEKINKYLEGKKRSNSKNPLFPPVKMEYVQLSSNEINKLSEKYFSLLKQEKYGEIAELFHYPPDNTAEETRKYREIIMEFHKLMKREWGEVKSHKLFSTGSFSYLTVGLNMEKSSYPPNNPMFKQVIFEVDFKKEGNGGIVLQFCKPNNKLKIRSIQFGLPPSARGAKEKHAHALKELEKISEKLNR